MTKFKINKKLKVMVLIFLIVVLSFKLHLLHKKHVEYKRIKKPTQSKKVKIYKKFTVNKKKEITFNENDLLGYHNLLQRIKNKQDYDLQENIKQHNKEYDEKQAELRRQEELRKQEEERQRQEQIRKQQEIQHQQELQKAQQNKQVNNSEINRGGDNQQGRKVTLICTFYTDDPSENGNDSGLSKSGKRLAIGMGACNDLTFGTQIYTSQLPQPYQHITIEDTGNPSNLYKVNNNTYRIDILVSSKSEANRLGIQKITGYIVK